jgi:SAM-dependent methyltransferase
VLFTVLFGMARTTWSTPAGSGDWFFEDYERGRPGWPRKAVELLDLPATATVLDLGAGTGKLTRLVLDRFDRVVAVEPAAAMRRILVTRTTPRRRRVARFIPLGRVRAAQRQAHIEPASTRSGRTGLVLRVDGLDCRDR